MSTTPQLDLRRLVVTGTARRPELADTLNSAAAIVRYDPPRPASRTSRLWLVPSEHREHVAYLVDRTAKTCACPDNRRNRGRLCKHRLAVEMFCRLNDEPEPPDAPDERR